MWTWLLSGCVLRHEAEVDLTIDNGFFFTAVELNSKMTGPETYNNYNYNYDLCTFFCYNYI